VATSYSCNTILLCDVGINTVSVQVTCIHYNIIYYTDTSDTAQPLRNRFAGKRLTRGPHLKAKRKIHRTVDCVLESKLSIHARGSEIKRPLYTNHGCTMARGKTLYTRCVQIRGRAKPSRIRIVAVVSNPFISVSLNPQPPGCCVYAIYVQRTIHNAENRKHSNTDCWQTNDDDDDDGDPAGTTSAPRGAQYDNNIYSA